MAENVSADDVISRTMGGYVRNVASVFLNRIMTVIITSVSSRKSITNLLKFKDLLVRNRSFNSHDWLKRREVDPYVELSKQQNYRCRSAFKLIEIDDKYKIIQPGFKVLDIGAAPGSWSQVLAERTNSNARDVKSPVGLVIAVDLNSIHEIPGVIILPQTDFKEKSCHDKILEILGKDKFDFVFSDMAPSATGVRNFDKDRMFDLLYGVIVFAVNNLKVGGGCLVKIWEGGESKNFKEAISRFFKSVKTVKPSASYSNSSEAFVLARQFLGLKT